MLLQVEQLNKIYNQGQNEDLIIFKDLNFSLSNSNKISTIFGPSGVGKTTLLNMLGTVDAPNSGKITLKNIVYKEQNYQLIRKNYIGYMFQFHYLLPEFTVFENLDLTLRIKKPNYVNKDDARYKITELLDDFRIMNKIDCYPNELSGGEKQRVSLARAIINSPALVLADEPTGNLDSENSKNIINAIHKISAKKDIKFIIATHNTEFKNISDSIYSIEKHSLIKK